MVNHLKRHQNAIIAKDPPTKEEDPDFSPEDARYP
jgi:hypothetical protein